MDTKIKRQIDRAFVGPRRRELRTERGELLAELAGADALGAQCLREHRDPQLFQLPTELDDVGTHGTSSETSDERVVAALERADLVHPAPIAGDILRDASESVFDTPDVPDDVAQPRCAGPLHEASTD